MITEARKRDVALVVDDSPETLRLLTDALDGAGMTVMVALDGAGAIASCSQPLPAAPATAGLTATSAMPAGSAISRSRRAARADWTRATDPMRRAASAGAMGSGSLA